GAHPKFEILTPTDSTVPAVEERLSNLKKLHEELKESLSQAVQTQKEYADRHRSESPPLSPGDEVWLDARNITTTRPCRKLDHKRLGPFKIVKQINDVAYKLDLPPHMGIWPVFHVSLLEKT